MNDSTEKHIFRTLPPDHWFFAKKMNDPRPVSLIDYCSYLKDGTIELSEIIFDGVEVEDRNVSDFDVGQTYFIVSGSREKAEALMKNVANNFNSYLKKNSKNGKNTKFNYELIN